ncbi:MAG TPA: hypothetical protein VFM35_12130, partial [Candidatus Binatia bacterium]|nr:hypothetical protein [Candidatus Binatia bacterium]
MNRQVVQGKPSLGSRIFPVFTTGSAGLFDLTLLCEIEAVAVTLLTDEFRAVLPIREVLGRGMDYLPETLDYLLVEFWVERVGDFGSLQFVVFDGSFRGILKP